VASVIDDIDHRLETWAETVLGAGLASPSLADPSAKGRGVSLYLLDLVQRPPARAVPQPHVDITLRYLVTTWAESPHEAHRMLAELLMAASSNGDFEVELGSPGLDMWTALRVPPRPAFVLRVPLRKDLPVRRAPLVRRPMAFEITPAGALTGVCVGPERIPLTGALVEVPSLNVATRTDHDGRFAFSSVPREAAHLLVRATAKGKTVTVDAAARADAVEPLVIQFDMTEG
jgi:hypothetical protein